MPDRAETLKKLDLIRILAAIDLAMLVVLVFFSLSENESGVSILGPIHGLMVLALLFFTATGVTEKRWGWIFPITTLIPIFALFYDAKLRKQIASR